MSTNLSLINIHNYLQQQKIVHQNALLSKEKLCLNLSIFGHYLHSLKKYLDDVVWHGEASPDGVFNVLGDERQFHRLWSVLQFVYCIPARSETEFTVE